jgi:hypothetical protein
MRQFLQSLTLGTLLATTPLNAQEPEDTGLQSFADIPTVTMETVDEKVAEGFSVVYVYGSTPERESVLKTEWANYTFFNSIEAIPLSNINYFRFDMQTVRNNFDNDSQVGDYFGSKFSIEKYPAVMFICNGESVRIVNSFIPKFDPEDSGFSNPKNHVASQKLVDSMVKATTYYSGECQ